jgi:hypothetical protein
MAKLKPHLDSLRLKRDRFELFEAIQHVIVVDLWVTSEE